MNRLELYKSVKKYEEIQERLTKCDKVRQPSDKVKKLKESSSRNSDFQWFWVNLTTVFQKQCKLFVVLGFALISQTFHVCGSIMKFARFLVRNFGCRFTWVVCEISPKFTKENGWYHFFELGIAKTFENLWKKPGWSVPKDSLRGQWNKKVQHRKNPKDLKSQQNAIIMGQRSHQIEMTLQPKCLYWQKRLQWARNFPSIHTKVSKTINLNNFWHFNEEKVL